MKLFKNISSVKIETETAVALGYFDSVHIGHKAVINGAVSSGMVPAVFTFSGGKNGNIPILSDKEKEQKIENLGVEYYICPDFSEICDLSGEEFFYDIIIGKMNAKKIYCGCDFKFGRGASCNTENLKALCREYKIELNIVPFVCKNNEKVSTTMIRQLLDNGKTAEAEELL